MGIYGVYGDLILILSNSIFCLLKGDYKTSRVWGTWVQGCCIDWAQELSVEDEVLGKGFRGFRV